MHGYRIARCQSVPIAVDCPSRTVPPIPTSPWLFSSAKVNCFRDRSALQSLEQVFSRYSLSSPYCLSPITLANVSLTRTTSTSKETPPRLRPSLTLILLPTSLFYKVQPVDHSDKSPRKPVPVHTNKGTSRPCPNSISMGCEKTHTPFVVSHVEECSDSHP
jgi:hypothetical protein